MIIIDTINQKNQVVIAMDLEKYFFFTTNYDVIISKFP